MEVFMDSFNVNICCDFMTYGISTQIKQNGSFKGHNIIIYYFAPNRKIKLTAWQNHYFSHKMWPSYISEIEHTQEYPWLAKKMIIWFKNKINNGTVPIDNRSQAPKHFKVNRKVRFACTINSSFGVEILIKKIVHRIPCKQIFFSINLCQSTSAHLFRSGMKLDNGIRKC